MAKFKYDDKGNLVAYKDGKKVGGVVGMGDVIMKGEAAFDEINTQPTDTNKKPKKTGG